MAFCPKLPDVSKITHFTLLEEAASLLRFCSRHTATFFTKAQEIFLPIGVVHFWYGGSRDLQHLFACKLALVQLHLQSILKEIYLVCRTESFCITHSANPRLLRTFSAFLCLFFQLLTVSFLAISIDCQTKIHRSHDLLLRISHTFCALFFLVPYSCYHIRIQLQEFMSPKTSQHPRWVLMSVLPVATMLKLFPSMIVLTNLSQNLTNFGFQRFDPPSRSRVRGKFSRDFECQTKLCSSHTAKTMLLEPPFRIFVFRSNLE